MTEFTKGPWNYFLAGDERGIYIGVDLFRSSSRVVTIIDCDDLPEDETRANAHLIAAAPDLYEALDRLVGEIKDYHVSSSVLDAIEASIYAIAKALGEA